MTGRLAGRVALVTGGASGIGRAVAERLVADGAVVAIGDIQDSSAVAGGHCRGFHADLSQPGAATTLVGEVVQAFGQLDILINNAGIATPTPFSADFDEAGYQHLLQINLTASVACAAAAIAAFLAVDPPRGVIVNISSVHEIVPKPGYLAYAISKGGMGALTRTLALEYADRGIRVNGVGPGATLTAMNQRWAEDPDQRAVVERHIPMGRAADPAEIAGAVAFLASDEASYITGQTLHVCGGLSLYADFQKNWST